MLVYCYFQKYDGFPAALIPESTLKRKEVEKANQLTKRAKEEKTSGKGHYRDYTDTDRARMGKYTTENGISSRAGRYWNFADDIIV